MLAEKSLVLFLISQFFGSTAACFVVTFCYCNISRDVNAELYIRRTVLALEKQWQVPGSCDFSTSCLLRIAHHRRPQGGLQRVEPSSNVPNQCAQSLARSAVLRGPNTATERTLLPWKETKIHTALSLFRATSFQDTTPDSGKPPSAAATAAIEKKRVAFLGLRVYVRVFFYFCFGKKKYFKTSSMF